MENPIELVGKEFINGSGKPYMVILITNLHSDDKSKHPITIVYEGRNGKTWSDTLDYFLEKMTLKQQQ